VVLDGLGVSLFELDQPLVTVSGPYLRFLFSKLAAQARVDSGWYEQTNPDVRAAKLADEVGSYQAHFEAHGYLEGRLPFEPAFDADWYRDAYADLRDACPTAQAAHEHFERTGCSEGRAGVAEHLADAEQWRLGTVK
jgi:hypothetical protein